MAGFTVAKIEGSDAQRMANNELESFYNPNTDEFFTYDDLVPNEHVEMAYDIIEIDEQVGLDSQQLDVASGTSPVYKNRKMFPR